MPTMTMPATVPTTMSTASGNSLPSATIVSIQSDQKAEEAGLEEAGLEEAGLEEAGLEEAGLEEDGQEEGVGQRAQNYLVQFRVD
jgi:hypothetical protein